MNKPLESEPVFPLSDAEREGLIAKAQQSLREGWEAFEASGLPMPTDEEIDADIARVRRECDERNFKTDAELSRIRQE